MKKEKPKVKKARYYLQHYHVNLHFLLLEDLSNLKDHLPRCFAGGDHIREEYEVACAGKNGDGDFYIALSKGIDEGMLTHEISHVTDWIFEYIGEDAPGIECTAYLQEAIDDYARKAFEKWGYKSNFKQLFDICNVIS